MFSGKFLAAFSVFALICAAGGLAEAQQLPPRKPGLWQMQMSFEGRQMPPMASEHCIDAETDKLMQATGSQMASGLCEKQDIKQSAGTIVIDSVCNIGGTASSSHSVMTGDFNSAYTVKVESKSQAGGAMAGADGVTRMTVEAKWIGACKPGQKPGDIVMGNGMKINIKEMPGMKRP